VTAEGRSALNAKLVSDARWNETRETYGVNTATITKDQRLHLLHSWGYDAPLIIANSAKDAPQITTQPKLDDIYADIEIAKPKQPVTDDSDDEIERAMKALEAAMKAKSAPKLDESRIIELVKLHAGKPAHVTIDLRTPKGVEPKGEGLMHYQFPYLMSAINAGVSIMLVGPAGSGKTTACEKAAHLLGLKFYFTGALDSAYKLMGFIDAQGRLVRTAFREAYEHGGVFLYDEIDGSLPGPVLAFNAALANGHADFPDGMVTRHPDFRCVAAANTFGRGADRQYVGRMQLDAASLDRFVTLDWQYDIGLEAALIGIARPEKALEPAKVEPMQDESKIAVAAALWFQRVQDVRAKIEQQKIRHVVSPRATIFGAKLLSAGWPQSMVEDCVLWKGLDKDQINKIS
jgi:hypothetical protein